MDQRLTGEQPCTWLMDGNANMLQSFHPSDPTTTCQYSNHGISKPNFRRTSCCPSRKELKICFLFFAKKRLVHSEFGLIVNLLFLLVRGRQFASRLSEVIFVADGICDVVFVADGISEVVL